MFPHLTQMARDVFAVPATGAGVECQFRKRGRIMTWARALLHPDTVRDAQRLSKSHWQTFDSWEAWVRDI